MNQFFLKGDMDPYVALGISKNATLEELKQAYRLAVRRYHPDSPNGTGNAERLQRAVDAYNMIKVKYDVAQPSENPFATKSWSDPVTLEVPTDILVQNLNSSNIHSQLAAIEALAIQGTPESVTPLQETYHSSSQQLKRHIIHSLGKSSEHANPLLLTLIEDPDPAIVTEAIKSLEQISMANRQKIIKHLKRSCPFQQKLLFYLWGSTFFLFRPQSQRLGGILLREQKISHDQLKIALLLHKRFSILLGQTLAQLGYVKAIDIQHAIRHND